ncbi:hypothetical protein J2Y45_002552 [Dyadobacter sp. BE34]|uniref:Uncharacterized protein n=1 Tax=Dyadobacter fermentans TaxID=94254 RepID=A0ABU1QVF7_9BACT|nr:MULTISPECIES: hypothetical protein [Dyadobacter]MDR6805140.1 hypothetical protein [Dyadobacter fermentans]MDR7043101.1 hypothetical protein [Dyadobacter sp. BE242]MDR7197413.1 hypothetical protein [Dyadobacter sp. BE34]MDR7215154.1 hypothetical protein [Dyadobacter sp. BE31]MDR7262689.1 hypothetical protein [Dyadobacter sp. BE32]
MLDVVIVLVIIALVLLFLRAGRQNTIVYRKRVAPSDRESAIRDQPSDLGPSANVYSDNTSPSDHTFQEALAFGGGDFGGAGAGDSYDISPNDALTNDFVSFDAAAGDFSNSCAEDSDFSSSDSGPNDSGSSDSYSDSSGDNTSFSSD